MADRPDIPGTASVTDRRPVPRGVLPRGVQTWLMAGLAVGMLLIILLTGQPEAPARPVPTAGTTEVTSPDRVREYQERLRLLDPRAARDTAVPNQPLPPSTENDRSEARPVDALAAERQRRDYESLFARNIVVGPNSDAQHRDGALEGAVRATDMPSVDEVADAVVRATSRANGTTVADPTVPQPRGGAAPVEAATLPTTRETEPISAAGPLHRILEGTLIDTVLKNRLDGSVSAPVDVLVTNPTYSHSGHRVLIPAGARILGETRPVQSFGETRLAVAFHRLLMPDGRTYLLDQFRGLNQIGDSGLKDQVTQHYWSTFGAAAAVGLVSGLAQLVGSSSLGRGDGDRTIVIAGGTADATAQSVAQVMNRFLNRLPTVTIREGRRVKVYVTSDLELPAYTAPTLVQSLRGETR